MRLTQSQRAGAVLAIALGAAQVFGGCAARRFAAKEVSPGIFEGFKPRTQADFDLLRSHGIHTILSLQQLPWDIYPERRHAWKNGFVYRNVPILASPLEPNEQRVKEALLTLNEPSLRPIFVHCLLGEDRNTFIIGLYRIYYQDWAPEAAWQEMLRSGFHDRPRLRGFATYFWKHTAKPDWVRPPTEYHPP